MRNLLTILFWGALWGVVEATLGWFMHLVHFRGEMLLLYPIGLVCMMMAAQQTKQTSAVIKVAAVAASIKLFNLLMLPSVPFFYVTNPAVAILLEGLITWAIYAYAVKRGLQFKKILPLALLLVVGSLFAFSGWQHIMDVFVHKNPALHQAMSLQFYVQRSLVVIAQALMLTGALFLVPRIRADFFRIQWRNSLAIPLLILAVLLNVFL